MSIYLNKNSSWGYTSASGYTFKEDSLGGFMLTKDNRLVAGSTHPYPLLNESLKQGWLKYREVLEIASILHIEDRFVSSLSELEEK